MTTPEYIAKPKRDLTWLEPRDQQERADMLNRLDAALMGAEYIGGSLGETTKRYAEIIGQLRFDARSERHRLLAELEAAG